MKFKLVTEFLTGDCTIVTSYTSAGYTVQAYPEVEVTVENTDIIWVGTSTTCVNRQMFP